MRAMPSHSLMDKIFRSGFWTVLGRCLRWGLVESKPVNPIDSVNDNEDLARFLTSSRLFKKSGAKPAAFIPFIEKDAAPIKVETSVYRYSCEPRVRLQSIGNERLGLPEGRTLYGAAIVTARDVRSTGLEVDIDEPPPRHAVIVNWPWDAQDPVRAKAQQLMLAMKLARAASLCMFSE